jgi:hypothetical protein
MGIQFPHRPRARLKGGHDQRRDEIAWRPARAPAAPPLERKQNQRMATMIGAWRFRGEIKIFVQGLIGKWSNKFARDDR